MFPIEEGGTFLRDDEEQFRIYPDALNGGEKKFMQDISEYVRHNSKRFNAYEVYLMRNVESLKRIGIFLEWDEAVFLSWFCIVDASQKWEIDLCNLLTQNDKRELLTRQRLRIMRR